MTASHPDMMPDLPPGSVKLDGGQSPADHRQPPRSPNQGPVTPVGEVGTANGLLHVSASSMGYVEVTFGSLLQRPVIANSDQARSLAALLLKAADVINGKADVE
jgi:hypothetical protein